MQYFSYLWGGKWGWRKEIQSLDLRFPRIQSCILLHLHYLELMKSSDNCHGNSRIVWAMAWRPWEALSFVLYQTWKRKKWKWKPLSCVWLFVTPCTVAHQAPLSMEIFQAITVQWVATSSSMGSFQPRNQTQISGTAGRFFTVWATREAKEYWGG